MAPQWSYKQPRAIGSRGALVPTVSAIGVPTCKSTFGSIKFKFITPPPKKGKKEKTTKPASAPSCVTSDRAQEG